MGGKLDSGDKIKRREDLVQVAQDLFLWKKYKFLGIYEESVNLKTKPLWLLTSFGEVAIIKVENR